MTLDPGTIEVLVDIGHACHAARATWALIGGQALLAHGVPRDTVGVDCLINAGRVGEVATALVQDYGWVPVAYDQTKGDFVTVEVATARHCDDPVLAEVAQVRLSYPLRTPTGVPVELLTAQHPVEIETLESAITLRLEGEEILVAPLASVLLVKAKANRRTDVAAIEEAAEHLPRAALRKALAWAEERDPGTAEALHSIVAEVWTKRTPKRAVGISEMIGRRS